MQQVGVLRSKASIAVDWGAGACGCCALIPVLVVGIMLWVQDSTRQWNARLYQWLANVEQVCLQHRC